MIYQEQSITELVAQLPEVYQPIFRHSEFNAQASRSRACFDRLETITSFMIISLRKRDAP